MRSKICHKDGITRQGSELVGWSEKQDFPGGWNFRARFLNSLAEVRSKNCHGDGTSKLDSGLIWPEWGARFAIRMEHQDFEMFELE